LQIIDRRPSAPGNWKYVIDSQVVFRAARLTLSAVQQDQYFKQHRQIAQVFMPFPLDVFAPLLVRQCPKRLRPPVHIIQAARVDLAH
jgi:hypothetical protein